MQRSLITIAICVVLSTIKPFSLSAQTNTANTISADTSSPFNQLLTVEQMQKDLLIFRDIRQKANSGLYRYRTTDQIDSIYKIAQKEISQPLNLISFYHIILRLTDFEGSCHNYTEVESSKLQFLKKQITFFPYALKYIGGKIIFNNSNASIPPGAEIISVNSVTADKLLQSFYKYMPADGYVMTEKQSGDLDNSFGLRYILEYGLTDKYSVEYKLPGKTKRSLINISSVSLAQRQQNLDQKYSAKIDDLTNYKKQPTHNFQMTDENTGLLNFRVFSMASGLDDPAFPGYVKFIDSVFVSLDKNKVANLIIDLRGNPGGADPMFEQPMMYLTDHTFRENDSAYIIFDDVPYEEYFWGITTDHKMIGDELTGGKQFLKSYFPKLINGKNDQDPKHNPVYRPKQPRFKGKLYLLIDERVASAGSHLASLIKGYADNLTIVGVETCGGYLGHNGHMPMIYELPESKIKTKFSIVYVMQDAPAKPDQPVGRGIIPDHTIWQSYDDFMKQRDTQMEFTKQLIRKSK